jgi:hypothetical protein
METNLRVTEIQEVLRTKRITLKAYVKKIKLLQTESWRKSCM